MSDLNASILIKVLDAFSAPLRKLAGGLDDAKGRAERAGKAFKLSADLNQAAEGVGRFATGIAAPLKHAVNEFIGFEREMSRVAALSDEIGTVGFEKMRVQALELGAATAYSSEEAAQAMAQYAQAGRTVNEILAITPLTLAAAKANGTGLAETAAIIGHTMSGMGIATSDTARVVDVLTAGAAASDMSLSDMGTALAYVGPVARQAGMSLELTTAFLSKMKDAGLEASSVGTGFRAVLTAMLDPSKEARKAFQQLGFSQKELVGLQKQIASGHVDDALRSIGAASEKLPNETRLKLMAQIFGREAQSAASIAITASMDVSEKGLGKLNADLHKVDGTTLRLAKVMEDNLGGSIERAGGAIGGLSVKVGEILKPTVEAAAESVDGLVTGLTAWVNAHPAATKASLELVAGLAATAFALKATLLAASAFTAAQGAMALSFGKLSGSLLGKFGLVGAALAAGVAVGLWANEAFNLSDKISSLMGRSGGVKAGKQGMGQGEEHDDKTVIKDGKVTYIDPAYFPQKRNAHHMDAAMLGPTRKPDDTTPPDVRAAIEAGATNMEQVNAFLAAKQHPRFFAAERDARERPLLLREDADLGGQGALAVDPILESTRLRQRQLEAETQFKKFGAPGQLSAPPAGIAADAATKEQTTALESATREQTASLVEALRSNEKVMSEVLAEQRKQRGRPSSGGRALAGQGAY